MSEQNSNNTAVNLSELRDKIDNVDKQIQSLINERASYAIAVAKSKKDNEDNPIFFFF